MSHDTSTAVAKLRGLTAIFDNNVKAYQPFWPTLAVDVPSDGADEEYGMLGRVAAIREWLGDRDFKEMRAAKWTLTNKLWEVSHGIPRQDLDDDRLGMHRLMLAQIGVRASQHPDSLLFTLINDGESGACFDGQFFFDTDHEWGDSGVQSNDLTYAAASGTTPTVAELKLAFNAAMVALVSFKDDRGELLNGDVYDDTQQITIVAHPTLKQTLEDALSVRLQSTGGDNVVIARPKIITSARVSSTAKFDIYKTDEPLKPFIMQNRTPLKRQMKGATDIEEKMIKFMTEARYVAGYGAWWTGVRTTFT